MPPVGTKPDTARLRENLALMEQRPFDGVILEAVGMLGEKKQCSMRATFHADPRAQETGNAGTGSARAAGVAGGCFIQSCDVKPGERYALRGSRRVHSSGAAWVRARWQTADARWTLEEQDRVFSCQGPADARGGIFGVVEVPEGAGMLVLLPGVGGQMSAEDAVWFDDVRVRKSE